VFGFFIVIHTLICVALVLMVLLQSGRGGGLAGAFGAQTAQTIFGGRGAATFLSKATSYLAIGFMAMSVLLAVLSARGAAPREGLLQQRARQAAGQAQLPPSTSSFNPSTADTAAGGDLFAPESGGAAPAGQPPQ
jgi:preprotein translocase subunit SecG